MEQQGAPPLRLAEAFISQSRLRSNVGIVGYVRIFASLAAGLMAGVLGVTGWIGFAFFIVLELLTIPPLLLKAQMNPTRFLKPGSHLYFGQALNSTTLLTFILFWTITNNFIHLF